MPDLENRMTTVERRLDRVFDSLDIFATNQIRLDEALATLVDAQIRSQQQYRDTQQQFRDTQQQFRDTDEKIAKQFRDTQEQYRRTDERIAQWRSNSKWSDAWATGIVRSLHRAYSASVTTMSSSSCVLSRQPTMRPSKLC